MRNLITKQAWMFGLISMIGILPWPLSGGFAAGGSALDFRDVRARTGEFISYSRTLRLTPEQERIKKEALGSVPAPCCNDYSAATCCCPCNLAKSVWGLANYSIVKLGYSASQVREAVRRWINTINPKGFTGNACYRGGCSKPFASNGCGGMSENSVVF